MSPLPQGPQRTVVKALLAVTLFWVNFFFIQTAAFGRFASMQVVNEFVERLSAASLIVFDYETLGLLLMSGLLAFVLTGKLWRAVQLFSGLLMLLGVDIALLDPGEFSSPVTTWQWQNGIATWFTNELMAACAFTLFAGASLLTLLEGMKKR